MEHVLDLSRLTRRKPDMSKEAIAKATYLEGDELVTSIARKELDQHRKGLDLCCDAMHKSDWSGRTFREKIDALVDDSLYWSGSW